MPFSKKDQQKLHALGQRVRQLREERGLSLKALAHTINKDPQSVHRLEQGGVNPGYLYLLAVCEGLEIEITELLEGVEEE
ncbi:helix-turn-helix transcriptional regulator [Paraflavitalea sp. CAU 1676]|uniref:helix-turn-helix domain-containing protein n=1 Tax=Paraflavitalea sp. CAU 1676 TaxID=3032598 RepID=UPI0023DBB4E9|nr:helix-turn-helix transcriptional regulator [Paraflavitalea sp. CAU 1676]MDF2192519.1 helix-turn-helix transcriptional regulator [Paraflavitalea sp. CAU 1676]